MANTITINNGLRACELTLTATSRPPTAPLDFGALHTLFNSMTAYSTAPSDPSEKDAYLDDGTNTESGEMGFRRYNGTAWEDFGLQEGGITSTPATGQYEVTDIRMDPDLTMIVEYDDVPEA